MKKHVQRMASYKKQIKKYGTPICKEKYQELMLYAKEKGIKLSCFKEFVGDIKIIEQVIDDILPITLDFPLLLSNKKGVCLELDYSMGTDFATTLFGHTIHLNAIYYSNLEMLISDYNEAVQANRFVKETDWHSIIRHEIGHVVANLYHIDAMKIAKQILNTNSDLKVLDVLADELSLYSVEFDDGREIISEAFSGYYSNTDTVFSKKFVNECIRLSEQTNSKGGRQL